MTAPPPRLWWARRSLFLMAAAAWPWVICLAAVGATGLAWPIPPHGPDWTLVTVPAGPSVAVGRTIRGPAWDPGSLILGWVDRPHPTAAPQVRQTSERPLVGVLRTDWWYGDPAGPTAGRATRPADFVMWEVSLWWLLGLPAGLSACAVWRAAWTAREPARPSVARRLARPWTATFAAVGVLMWASGTAVPDPGGSRETLLLSWIDRTPPDYRHPRAVTVRLLRNRPVPGGGFMVLWQTEASVGLWWLLLPAAAGNAVTLVRTGCRGRLRVGPECGEVVGPPAPPPPVPAAAE